MAELEKMGEFVRSASSTIEAPVVRRLKEQFSGGAKRGGSGGGRARPAPRRVRRDQGRRDQGGRSRDATVARGPGFPVPAQVARSLLARRLGCPGSRCCAWWRARASGRPGRARHGNVPGVPARPVARVRAASWPAASGAVRSRRRCPGGHWPGRPRRGSSPPGLQRRSSPPAPAPGAVRSPAAPSAPARPAPGRARPPGPGRRLPGAPGPRRCPRPGGPAPGRPASRGPPPRRPAPRRPAGWPGGAPRPGARCAPVPARRVRVLRVASVPARVLARGQATTPLALTPPEWARPRAVTGPRRRSRL